MTMAKSQFVGIDVGKTWLDIAVWGAAGTEQVSNDDNGVSAVLDQLYALDLALVVVEATGGYEQLLVQELLLRGFPVAVANPTRVRALAKAAGQLAKTDVIDARLIAEYAALIQPAPMEPKLEVELCLRALVTRREQLVAMRTAEQNRLQTAHRSMRVTIGAHLDWLKEQIESWEVEMVRLSRSLPELQEQIRRLDSIPGVGFITALTVLVELPELGQLNRQKMAALAGLAPCVAKGGWHNES